MKEITIETIKELRPNLEVVDVSGWSHGQWLEYRKDGIGCSETGAMLDHNEYLEPIVLFNQKTGMVKYGTEDNNAMFMGRFMEDHVGTLWEHYDIEDGSWEATCNNLEKVGQPLRKRYKPEIYVRNPKYPWLFGGPDGLFWHDGDLAVLEIKTIMSMAAKKYKNGIPVSYIFQVHAYMMIFDIDYCELAMLQDGREFDVYPIERNEKICTLIEEGGAEFWAKVLEGRDILKEMKVTAEEDPTMVIHDKAYRTLEPPIKVKNERAFNEFLGERFQANPDLEIESTRGINQAVRRHEGWKAKKKLAEEKMKKYSAQVKYFMGEKCKLLDCPGYGVSYNPDKNGRRSLRINAKDA